MTAGRIFKVNGEEMNLGTSLFKPDSGEVYWYCGVNDWDVRLEGVEQTKQIEITSFKRLIETGTLVIESQPPGP